MATTRRRRPATARRTPRQAGPVATLPDPGPPTVVRFAPLSVPPPRPSTRTRSAAAAAGAAGVAKARTAVYVHGIGNHPDEQVLTVRWDRALFGQDMGDRTRMAYWINRARYPQAATCDCLDPRCACHDPEEVVRARRVLAIGEPDPARELREAVAAITADPAQQRFLQQVGAEMLAQARSEAATATATAGAAGGTGIGGRKGTYGVHGKGIGDALLRRLTDLVTGMALPDVQDFLFEPAHRQQMADVLLARLRTGGGPFVVVAHSQGSMIAYDVLRQLAKADLDVRLLVTIGSPLGLPPVRSVFKRWTKQAKLPFPPCVTRWINVAAVGDVVALDTDLGDDVARPAGARFENHVIRRAARDANPLFAGNAHAAMGYLTTAYVQEAIRDAVGREFASSLAQQLITSDLVERLEAAPDDQRHKVMIEIREDRGAGAGSIATGRERLHARLAQLGARDGGDVERLGIRHHARFVSADLDRAEIEVLRTEFAGLQVHRIWQNARKRALICRSAHVVQAAPAHQAYAAHGHGIEWAVLDTGIQHLHPHFARHRNIASLWDCTRSVQASPTAIAEPRGGFVDWRDDGPTWPADAEDFVDRAGHGTHVAGIIAGAHPHPLLDQGEALAFAGMAPKARLHSFKVLDDRGQGEDAWILVALDRIARINEQASGLRIHGVNLSLGGNFDPSVYGCGHTPLCTELRRLWRQGVVIVLAAGNEGFAVLQTLGDGPWHANLDLSIGDPANLEEAIAVGSIHRVNPHTFGVSYFSSRGPTADGRRKPDLVAPGEKILSARADFADHLGARLKPGALTAKQLASLTAEQLYVAESGTSMAAPHVSGLVAAFLSQRREFVGDPDRVKRLLLDHCTDLGRDVYAQGAGLPNLVRMLAST